MVKLSNSRQEYFCVLVAVIGLSLNEAYVTAGYKGLQGWYRRLVSDDAVSRRLEFLRRLVLALETVLPPDEPDEPKLVTPRREDFCWRVAAGTNVHKAYEEAGYTAHLNHLARLLQDARVMRRIRSLRRTFKRLEPPKEEKPAPPPKPAPAPAPKPAKCADKPATLDDVIRETEALAMGRPLELGEPAAGDAPPQLAGIEGLLSSSALGRVLAANVAEIAQTAKGTTFKFHNRQNSLNALARMLNQRERAEAKKDPSIPKYIPYEEQPEEVQRDLDRVLELLNRKMTLEEWEVWAKEEYDRRPPPPPELAEAFKRMGL
jgi:hypothetical protein